MAINTSTIDYICNDVRREAYGEFSDLKMVFVTYEPGKALAALQGKRHEISQATNADDVFKHLEGALNENFAQSCFFRLHQTLVKKLTPPFRRKQFTAIFLINSQHFHEQEDVRHWLYQNLWHALELRKNYESKNKDAYIDDKAILKPLDDRTRLAFTNMLGDCFACILKNLKGRDGHISSMSRQRAKETTQRIFHHDSALFPLPIAAEAAQIVFEDLYDTNMQANKPFTLAAQMAEEVAYTFDANTINKWQNFANRAQEMAWMGHDKNEILSTAVYTSEDAYVRSMAYLVAETLNISPQLHKELSTHNPFADQDVNEHTHQKKAQTIFNNIIHEPNPAEKLLKHATTQNQNLLNGNVFGWCAHALLEAIMPFQDIQAKDINTTNLSSERFDKGLNEVQWSTLVKLNRIILGLKRERVEITPQLVWSICEKDNEMGLIQKAIENARPIVEKSEPDIVSEAEEKKAASDIPAASIEMPSKPVFEIEIDDGYD